MGKSAHCFHCGRSISDIPVMGSEPDQAFCGDICKAACWDPLSEEGHDWYRGYPNRKEDVAMLPQGRIMREFGTS